MNTLDKDGMKSAGEAREGWFNTGLVELHKQRPWWYLGTKQASTFHDIRGVDFIAYVIYSGIPKIQRVPIQLKSSEEDFAAYYGSHSYAVGQNIVEMVIPCRTSSIQIANEFRSKLEEVRLKKFDYSSYFESLPPLQPFSLVLQQQMEEDRRKRPLRLPPWRNPPIWIQLWWMCRYPQQ